MTEARPFHKFWVPGPLPGENEIIASAKGLKGRGYGYAKLKRAWTAAVAKAARDACIPPLKRVRLAMLWIEPHKRRNPDNIAAGIKFILDGLVTAGVLENDGWSQIEGWNNVFAVNEKPGVSVIVTDVSKRTVTEQIRDMVGVSPGE